MEKALVSPVITSPSAEEGESTLALWIQRPCRENGMNYNGLQRMVNRSVNVHCFSLPLSPVKLSEDIIESTITRAATNDYFDNRMIG